MARKKKRSRRVRSDTEPVSVVEFTPSKRLTDFSVAMYGPPKVGKTTIANEWPKPITIATEAEGLKAMTAEAIPVRNWRQFKSAVRMITEDGGDTWKTVITDTVDLAYRYCMKYACEKYGFEHPSDEEYGKGWDQVAQEWIEEIVNIYNSGLTPIYVSHSKERDIRSRWSTRTKAEMTLPGAGRRVVLPLVDIILYLRPTSKVKGRGKTVQVVEAICRANEDFEAGDRTDRLPQRVILPKGKSYEALKIAFRKGKKKGKK